MAFLLVADDDPDIREIVALILEVAGHQVDTVADGAAALRAIQDTSYALVVLDNTMPVMTGLEVLRAVQDLEPTSQPVLLMLSALNTPRDVRVAMEAGADHYLAKPFESADLVRCVDELLAGRNLAGASAPGAAPE